MIRSALAAAGIALVLGSPLLAQQGRDETTFSWAKQLAAGSRVSIRNANGPITVREATDNRVDVKATKIVRSGGSVRDVAFDVSETGGGVEICALYDSQNSCRDQNRRGNRNSDRVRVEFVVLVPRSMRVNLSTGNGELSIARAGDELSASTGNGRITIGETSGRVTASTGNGDVRIESANGPVQVSTGNGRVFVATASGGVDANSGSGEIDVRMTSLSPDQGNMTINSGSGAIRVTLPEAFNGRIDASTGNGTLRSEFEMTIVGRLDAQHVRGTIGKGGPLLRLNTGNGMIELRKN